MIFKSHTNIVEGLRLPVGKINGYYKNIIPEEFTSLVLQAFLVKYPQLIQQTDEVLLGCAIGTGGNMARYATLKAGFSETVPAYSVDAQCASGLKAVIIADNQIKAGSNAILAGGMESNSLAPKRQYHPNDERFLNENTFYTQASFAPPSFGDSSLLKAAERVAHQFNISKTDMINWAIDSHSKANHASEGGFLRQIILPYITYFEDQSIKKDLTFERLEKAQSLALIDHTNTAHLHDGACVHFLASEAYCEDHDINPSFKILETATVGGSPTLAPMGVIWATEQLLSKTGLKVDEIDLFEVNESFAVNALSFALHFQVKHSKVNIFGGNLAFGHPFGASGAINLLHLMAAMKARDVKKGIVSIAAAGGLGMAILIEKI